MSVISSVSMCVNVCQTNRTKAMAASARASPDLQKGEPYIAPHQPRCLIKKMTLPRPGTCKGRAKQQRTQRPLVEWWGRHTLPLKNGIPTRNADQPQLHKMLFKYSPRVQPNIYKKKILPRTYNTPLKIIQFNHLHNTDPLGKTYLATKQTPL